MAIVSRLCAVMIFSALSLWAGGSPVPDARVNRTIRLPVADGEDIRFRSLSVPIDRDRNRSIGLSRSQIKLPKGEK